MLNTNQSAFVHALTAAASTNTLTENGAVTRSTTGSEVLNLFSQIGGLRANLARCEGLVSKSLQEDADLTTRCVFYSRDPRGGQGEREVFRTNMRALIKRDARFKKLVARVPEYGRWDDVVELMDVAPDEVFAAIKAQLDADVNSKAPSLLAKWLPSENTSSKVTRAQATKIRQALRMTSKDYRKMLSTLRKQIGVIECLMSAGKWNEINFEGVPSNAMLIYRNAFGTRAPEKFAAYKAALVKGEAKINASVLFPYDLVGKYLGTWSEEADAIVEAQWKALPDFFDGKTENSLVVCDVSGSMSGMPMNVSISLGIYTAERNRGIWKDKFMTFSSRPEMQTIVGNTLAEKVNNLRNAHWEMNTDIEAVFTKILQAAEATKMDPAEMVARVYIVSDMEFDAASSGSYGRGTKVGSTLFQTIKARFEAAGYNLPELVFWNVSARNQQTPMALDERGFLNVSGCSPSIFKYVVGKKFAGPYEMMLDVLNSPKYVGLSVTE